MRFERDEEPDSRTLALAARVEAGDQRALAIELGAQRRLLEQLLRDRHRAEGMTWVVRGLGGVVATVAISLAAWALSLGQSAAVDHERVSVLRRDTERLVLVQQRHQEELESVRREAMRVDTTLGSLLITMGELRDEVRELRRQMSARR